MVYRTALLSNLELSAATCAVANVETLGGGTVWAQSGPNCGLEAQLPCAGGNCAVGHVLYAPTGLCMPCGLEGALCCPDSAEEFSCILGQECQVGRDPFNTYNASAPYGFAQVCQPSTVVSDQSGGGSQPRPSARPVAKDTGLVVWRSSRSPRLAAAKRWPVQLDTMLGLSYAFYEIQRAGRLPPQTRIAWRGDSLKAASGGSLDGEFEGGYFDAGDHLKFMLPQAYSIARLCWAVRKNERGLKKTSFDGRSNYRWAREACKWGADFLYKAVVSKDQMLLHVGDIKFAHSYIGVPEKFPQGDRAITFCSSGQCSDIAGEVAASLAHAATAFKDRGVQSRMYWRRAKMAYAQIGVGSMTFGNSNEALPILASYYASSGVVSHVLFAAASMYAACSKLSFCRSSEADAYKQQAVKLGNTKEPGGGQKWFWPVPGWDNAWWSAAVLMASLGEEGPSIYGNSAFVHYPATLVDAWVNGDKPVQISEHGQRWVSAWGSNRFALEGAATLLDWAALPDEMRADGPSPQQARCAAVKQLTYVAGHNDRGSYIAGFGTDAPKRNHHRGSACPPWDQEEGGSCSKVFFDVANPNGDCPVFEDEANGICYKAATRANPLQTMGALIGGPKDASDSGSSNRVPYSFNGWNDWRSDWIGAEQAVDYNSGYTMALAAAIDLPESFWRDGCDGVPNSDLQLSKPAGTSRRVHTARSDGTWTWGTFEKHGYTRTLPANWFGKRPGTY